ncbi:MAG: NAD(P)/FAD-dependent oxidoreductase [Actinomycetota bacterium]|nr:NAD(P)/FAD-dependent oxidoreductase [Actinomycetota bacterium]
MTAVADSTVEGLDPASGPGHVAILGAGPIGLDAALTCLDKGWPCTVYESAASVAANVTAWSHIRLFTPWSMNVSARMLAHLQAAGVQPPGPAEHCPTGAEFAEQLLRPLAELPELAAAIRSHTRVLAVARQGLLKHEEIGSTQRGSQPFRLLLTGPRDGADVVEYVERADLLLDCTGSYGQANCLGDGGIPAPGEQQVADRIIRRIPDLDSEAEEWAGRRVLLVGAGKSAQTAARDLAELVVTRPDTQVLWAVRAADPDWGEVSNDPLPQRQELVEISQRLRSGAVSGVELRTGVVVEALRAADDGVAVTLRSNNGDVEQIVVDRIIGLTGFVGDTSLYRQLQVHECYATAAPMNLSAALLSAATYGPADCLAQASYGVDTLRVPEPNFFILGMKSYGRNSTFLLRVGYEQVDEVANAYS